jgi:hypothetical protein
MKTRFTIIAALTGLIFINSISQISTDYLGQTPPGDVPQIFAPGIVSISNRYEYGFSVSPNGKEIFFTCEEPGDGLMRIVKDGDTWSSPQLANLRKINAWEFEAFYTQAGDSLFFTSKDGTKQQFYYVTKTDTGWSESQKLVSLVNDDDVMWCSFSKNGNMYYTKTSDFSSYRSEYRNGIFQKGEKVASGAHPYVSADESFFVYNSSGDIYIRFKRNVGKSWYPAIKLNTAINTSSGETCPSISPDGKFMFFARYNDVGGKSDMYWVGTNFIDKLKKENHAPYLYNLISDTVSLSTAPYSYEFPDSLFIDDDGNNTLKYSAALIDGNPLPTWLSFDPDTKTFLVYPTESGTISIKITATDSAKAFVSSTLNLKYIVLTNSIKKNREQNIQIFPNPTEDKINITFGSLQYKKVIVEISDIYGKIISSETHNNISVATIDLAGNPEGIYILNLNIDGEVINKNICIE